MIAIIDYGMGNIHSVQKALDSFGAKTLVTNEAKVIASAAKVVLPGVGAFQDAMQELNSRGLAEAIRQVVKENKPLLGICLGMQLLFEKSQEAGDVAGLSLLAGEVKRFKDSKGLKVPHMGWNQLKIKDQRSKIKNGCPLLENIKDGAYVYFCHSYYPQPQDNGVIGAVTEYGQDFSSLVWKDNIFGAQFHPEKSQSVGLKILENFVGLC